MGLLAMLVLGILALVVAIVLLGMLLKVSIFAAKVILFGMLLLWLAKKLLGGSRRPRSRGVELVGRPVVDVAPPGPQRDKYDIAAERELDQELGL
jgi:membrane protein implicated in regulation of membrane protease activity